MCLPSDCFFSEHVGLVQSSHYNFIKCTSSHNDIAEKIVHLALL
jgi:hypothetical protein